MPIKRNASCMFTGLFQKPDGYMGKMDVYKFRLFELIRSGRLNVNQLPDEYVEEFVGNGLLDESGTITGCGEIARLA